MYSSFQAACLRRARMLILGVRLRLMRSIRDLARDGQIARGNPVPDAAVILTECDIQMATVFYRPVTADRLNQHRRIITAA